MVDYIELMTRYKDVFTGIGKLKDFQLNLHIDQQVQPVAQPLRRPAFSLREKIEKKLDELLQEDIIEKVEGPTPWRNPVVVVPKPNGDVRLCVDGCQVVGGLCNPEPLRVTELPQGPWQDIAVDFMGPLPSGDYVFAVTDHYSRYVEISISKTNTAEVAINSLKKMFATRGLPYTVMSDNGPHFVAEAFETLLKDNGIEHRRTTPLWPQANGEIERQNRSLLKRM